MIDCSKKNVKNGFIAKPTIGQIIIAMFEASLATIKIL